MNRKNLSRLFCLAAGLFALTGCGTAEHGAETAASTAAAATSTAATTAAAAAVSAADRHVMQPPAGGWTAEELMSVTYLYGRQLAYPLTLAALGDSIELKNMEPNIAGNIHVTLCHGGQTVGNAVFSVKTVEEVGQDTPIDQFMFLGDQNTPDSLVINGKCIDTEFMDMQSCLGEESENGETSDKKICYKTTGDSFTLAALNSSGMFSSLSIYGLCKAQ